MKYEYIEKEGKYLIILKTTKAYWKPVHTSCGLADTGVTFKAIKNIIQELANFFN